MVALSAETSYFFFEREMNDLDFSGEGFSPQTR